MAKMRIHAPTMAALFLILSIAPLPTFAQSNLGTVHLNNSGAAAAQPAFQRGLAALHSFWYDVAREEFGKAQEIDPDFALAYWGEALTYDFPFGFNPNVEKAREVLDRLGRNSAERQAKAQTELEKQLIIAVEKLYGDGDRQAREKAYFDSMKTLYRDNSDNVEIASFYVLSTLGKITLGRDLREKVEAVSILEPFLDSHPNHPGVLHYMIHAYDDAILAPLGLRAANTYARIAPASSHALHMPSHIFLQLGMWDKTTASNIDAYQSSIESANNRSKGKESYDTHALLWLIYSRTMEGALGAAEMYLREAQQIRDETGDSGIAFEYVLMATRYAVESQNWSTAPSAESADSFDNPVVKSSIYLAAGLKAISENNLQESEAMIHAIKLLKSHDGVVSNPRRLTITNITHLLLESALENRRGNLRKSIDLAEQAAALENEMALPIGPDYPILPAIEVYGKLLLEAEDYELAAATFERALSRRAKRPSVLFGLLKSARATGDRETEGRVRAELNHIWRNADEDYQPAKELTELYEPQ